MRKRARERATRSFRIKREICRCPRVDPLVSFPVFEYYICCIRVYSLYVWLKGWRVRDFCLGWIMCVKVKI